MCLGIPDVYAKNGKLPVGCINDREFQIGSGLSESVGVPTLFYCGQFVIKEKHSALVNEVKRVLVASAEAQKCLGSLSCCFSFASRCGRLASVPDSATRERRNRRTAIIATAMTRRIIMAGFIMA